MANNFLMTNDTSNNRWQLQYEVDQAGTKSTTLKTGGKFTDRDIRVDIITPQGSYQHPVSVSSGTITPTLSLDTSATTYGLTTTQPSGTTGTQFLTFNPNVTVNSEASFTSQVIINEGYLEAVNTSSGATSSTTVNSGTNYYIPIIKPTAQGGALSGSTTTTITVNGMNTSDDATDYFIDAAATGSVTRAAVTVSNSAGAIAANSITGIAQDSRDMGSSASRVFIPAASVSVTATKAATAPTATKITSGTGNVIGSNAIATSAPTSGYFVGFTAGAPATTLTPTKTLTTAGYISSNTQITASASTTASSKNFYIPITTGVASADTSSAAVSLNASDGSANGYNISASVNNLSDSEPTSGPYVAITYSGGGNSKVTTAGWFPTGALSTASTGNKIKYIPLKAATVTPKYANTELSHYFDPGSSSNYDVSITPQFTANQKGFLNSVSGNGTVGYWSVKTTSITQGISSITNGILSRGEVSWGQGWLENSGTIPAATFANVATGNTTYLDISNTTAAPILASGGYLYINKGYTDNLKISLAKLVPDWDTDLYPHIATSDQMLSGYVAYDQDGAVLSGEIPSKAAATYNVSTSNQTIAAKQYLAGAQTIRAVTTLNIDAANIKSGVNVRVGDSASATRIKNVTGAFTSSGTQTSGQALATSEAMLYGYSAWVEGAEVKGSILTKTSSDITFNENVATAAAGYYASNTSATMGVATIVSGTATISSAAYAYNSTDDNFTVTGSADVSAPTVSTTGYISSSKGTRSKKTGGATLNTSVSKIVGSISITGTKTKTPVIARQAFTISGVTDAASGAAVTTAPTSGVYVKVKSPAITDNVNTSISISTAGYGTNTNHGIANSGNVAVGANASADTYVPIKTADPTFTGGAVSGSVTGITGSNVTLSDANNGISVTGTASATRAAVTYSRAVSGWVSKSNGATAYAAGSATTLTGKTRYITAITVPADKSFTLTNNGSTNIINNKTLKVTSSNTNSSVKIIALPASGSTATDEQSVVTNGRWATTTVTPSASAQGPFYGAVTVKAISEGPAASGFSLNVTSASGSSDVTVGTLTSGKYPITANNLKVTGTLSASTNGYFTSGSATDSDVDSVVVGKMNAATISQVSGTGALTDKAATATFTGITQATTDDYNNGLKIQAIGKAGRAAATYTNTAGYIPAHTSAQTLSSAVSASTWNGTAYYLKGVTLTAPSTGERQFDITVPNGTDETITFHFHVDKDSNVYVD